jgi:hypothetical protein
MSENNSNKKAIAYAWSRYYTEVDRNMDLHRKYCEVIKNVNGDLNSELPTHLLDEMKELYNLLKKEIECPICIEIIQTDTLKITNCGHKFCETCFNRIEECAICRKKIYKKK